MRASDPSRIFVERKLNYPSKAVDGKLCPPGGNWWGDAANDDESPETTFKRELAGEELSLRHGKADMKEMGQLDGSGQTGEYRTPEGSAEVTPGDALILERLKEAVRTNTKLFGAYVINTLGEYFLSADPDDKRGKQGIASLAYYFIVPLDDDLWEELEYLQAKFGNLSNESLTLITSAAEMLGAQETETDPYKRFDFAWAHGWAIVDYFVENGVPGAEDLEPARHTSAVRLGKPPLTYDEILKGFDVDRMPPKFAAVQLNP